ncbi:MAG: hypothetical protein R3281_01725 [Balneolaceae bacterium]|nr:hypothetical protein [Balneolaceae bacterium]
MRPLRTISEFARADLMERVRRYSFLFMLLGAAGLAYTVFADYWRFRIAEHYRIAIGPVRTGTLVALVTNTILTFAGFYLVKGSVSRDRRLGIGPILSAAPVRWRWYIGGKYLSNLMVLLLTVIVLAAISMGITAVKMRAFTIGAAWQVLSPFLLLTVPVLFAIAGIAVLFDTLPYLRDTTGNIVYLFLWAGIFSISETYPSLDFIGLNTTIRHVHEALAVAHPDANIGSYALQINTAGQASLTGFHWSGLTWSSDIVFHRINFLGLGLLLCFLSSVALYFVNPFQSQISNSTAGSNSETAEFSRSEPVETKRHDVAGMAPPVFTSPTAGFFRTSLMELQMMLRGRSWWWYLVLAGLSLMAFVVDNASLVLLGTWLLPLQPWSALGCRDAQYGTDCLLKSCPYSSRTLIPARLAAGAGISILAGIGPLTYYLSTGAAGLALSLGSGAVFIPSLALCLGTWTNHPRAFEAVYLLLWYLGPLNGIVPLDFMGVTERAAQLGIPLIAGGISMLLLCAAWVGWGRGS